MEIKLMNRRTGKSTMIAKEMKKHKRSVCIQPTKMHMLLFCKTFKINKNRVYTMKEALIKIKDKRLRIYIDEIGACVGSLFLGDIHIATHTNPTMEIQQREWIQVYNMLKSKYERKRK